MSLEVPPMGLLSLPVFREQALSCIEEAERLHLTGYGKGLEKKVDAVARLQRELTETSPSPVRIRKIHIDIESNSKPILEARESLIIECHKLYENAFKSNLPFILGGDALRGSDSSEELINFGILSGSSHQCPRALLSRMHQLQNGGILCDGSWSVFKNDCCMLGIIHSLKDCHVIGDPAELRSTPEKIWDTSENRPKMVARELSMLSISSYVQAVPDDVSAQVGSLLTCLSPDRARSITLKNLFDTPQRLLRGPEESIRTIKEILRPQNTPSPTPSSPSDCAVGFGAGCGSG
jgi:hypothetical protein